MVELIDLVQRLAEARQALAFIEGQRKELQDEIDQLVQDNFGDRLDNLDRSYEDLVYDVERLEDEVKAEAVICYLETENKHPHSAVSVGLYTVLKYEDEAAHAYCVAHLQNALKIDRRKFEAVAKVAKLPFVEERKEPRAKIARDLSDFLPQPPGTVTVEEMPF